MATPASAPRLTIGKMEQVMTTLRVGSASNEKTFYVHKGVLCTQSPFFANALADGKWKESQDSVVSLPEAEPSIFEAYVVDWLYTGKMVAKQPDWLLLEGYVFAEAYDVPGLRNRIVRDFYSAYVWGGDDEDDGAAKLPSYLLVARAFRALPPNCMLCKLILELYAVNWCPDADDDDAEVERDRLPEAFVRSLMVRLGRRQATDECVDYLSEFIEEMNE